MKNPGADTIIKRPGITTIFRIRGDRGTDNLYCPDLTLTVTPSPIIDRLLRLACLLVFTDVVRDKGSDQPRVQKHYSTPSPNVDQF